MVKNYKETGFLTKLSQEKKIKIVSVEPSQKDLIKFVLSQKNKKEDILSWILLNILIHKKRNIVIIKKAIKLVSKNIKLNEQEANNLICKNFSKYDKSLSSIETIVKKIPIKIARKLESPFIKYSKINKVGEDLNLGRDLLMREKIINLLNKRKNVFGVLGLNHFICQKKDFESFLKLSITF